MLFQIFLKWLTVLFLVLGFANLGTQPSAVGHESSLDQPWKLLEKHHASILQLSSDDEALHFNKKFMPTQKRPPHPATRRNASRNKDQSDSVSQEIQPTITRFWAAMATIGYAQKLRAVPEAPLNTPFFSKTLLSNPQRAWILSKPSLEKLKPLLEFQQKLSMWPMQEPVASPPGNDYSHFTSFHDHAQVTSDRPSWTNLFTNLGFKGIETRLDEYWQQKNPGNARHRVSNFQKHAYIQQYSTSRLLPIFHTHFLTQVIQVEAHAYDVAWKSWQQLQQWQQQEQTNHAMMRLCGTWKWIIHNHQNHGDHKTTMTFSTAGSMGSHVQPTTILIHGDTVYLQWRFPQGIQEDSLLLSNRDTRLEGTFRNSLGPHGSISGQRLSHCQE